MSSKRRRNIDLRLALGGRSFLIGVVAFTVAIFIASANTLVETFQGGGFPQLEYPFHANLVLAALSSPVLLFCAPIICTVPYTASFVDEYKSGYLKSYLPRIGRPLYLKNKLWSVGLSGGLVLFLGIVAAYLLCLLIFSPMEVVASLPADGAVDMGEKLVTEGQATASGGGLSQMLSQALVWDILAFGWRYFLVGALWSLVGCLMASLSLSRYMAYASPFVIYYVLIIICERYVKNLYILHPQGWLLGLDPWPGGMWGLSLFLVELILLVALGLYFAIGRRIACE